MTTRVEALEGLESEEETRIRTHVEVFAGGSGSAPGLVLDQRIRNFPFVRRNLRTGAIDTCPDDNLLIGRAAHSRWLSTYTIGGDGLDDISVVAEEHPEWAADFDWGYLASAEGMAKLQLSISGTDMRPCVAAMLAAVEHEKIRAWLRSLVTGFDPTDRGLSLKEREFTVTAGPGGTGITTAIALLAMNSLDFPGDVRRLVILDPSLFPTSTDQVRERRHHLIAASIGRTLAELIASGTDPNHPFFGGPLPGFRNDEAGKENIEPGFIRQVVVVGGESADQSRRLTFEDAQRMLANWRFYMPQVPQLCGRLAVDLKESQGMIAANPAARRVPHVFAGLSFHVAEMWREVPAVKRLQTDISTCRRMLKGLPDREDGRFQGNLTAIREQPDRWRAILREELSRRMPAPVFDANALLQALRTNPVETVNNAVTTMEQLAAVADMILTPQIAANTGRAAAAELAGLVERALARFGIEPLREDLVELRVALGEEPEVRDPGAQELTDAQAQELRARAAGVAADMATIRRRQRNPGGSKLWRAILRVVGAAVNDTEAAEMAQQVQTDLHRLEADLRSRASALLGRILGQKREQFRAPIRSTLDGTINFLEQGGMGLSERISAKERELKALLELARTERFSTQFNVIPFELPENDEELSEFARIEVPATLVEQVFARWITSEHGTLEYAERELDLVLPQDAEVDGRDFAEHFLANPEAGQYLADQIREAKPYIRINQKALRGVRVTERCFLVYPKALQGWVDSQALSEERVTTMTAEISAIFVIKWYDTIPLRAIANFSEKYDRTLHGALTARARGRESTDLVSEPRVTIPWLRFMKARRLDDRRALAVDRMASSCMFIAPVDPPALSVFAQGGWLEVIPGAMDPTRPLFQDEDTGEWCARFINNQGQVRVHKLGTTSYAYALDRVNHEELYRLACQRWLEACVKERGLDTWAALGAPVEFVGKWLADEKHDRDNVPVEGLDQDDRLRRYQVAAALPTLELAQALATEFNMDEQWMFDFGLVLENVVALPTGTHGAP